MDDAGRGKLEEVFAVLTGSEAALFRHNFMSGTHTLSVAPVSYTHLRRAASAAHSAL